MVVIRRVFLVGCSLLILIAGCSSESSEANGRKTIPAGEVKTHNDSFLAEETNQDLDDDGEKEMITLTISPKPLPDPVREGHYLWDDSHIWQLVVTDGEKRFSLFDDYVQGKAEFFVVQGGELVLEEQGTTLRVHRFTYHPDGYFEKQVLYDPGTIQYRSTVE